MHSISERLFRSRLRARRGSGRRPVWRSGRSTLLILMLLLITGLDCRQLTAPYPLPAGSFLRSLAAPGWGHYYADQQDWNRGKIHMTAEILLITGVAASVVQERKLRMEYHTLASLRAGVDTRGRGRPFRLAVGAYDSLDEYNDFQLRSRSWNQLFPDETRNRWAWQSEEDRRHYNELRNRSENAGNRVPMLVGAMVVNRVLSAISAYNQAKRRSHLPEIALSPVYSENYSVRGYVGTIRFTY